MNRRVLLISIGAVIVVSAAGFLFLRIYPLALPTASPVAKGPSAAVLLVQAQGLEAKGSLNEAIIAYQKLINDFPGSEQILLWQKKLEGLNIKLLFSPTVTPKCALYTVNPGDSLAKIANQFNTTVELIMKSNNISDNKIFPGQKIKIWNVPFNIFVDKSQNTLILKSNEEVFKTYVVSTGANNSSPVGTFKILNKLENPTWFKAGAVVPANAPENILGTRWMGFNLTGYGIHGTTAPQSLGSQATQGCVRMSNQEVEELYAIVPVGTEVTIVD